MIIEDQVIYVGKKKIPKTPKEMESTPKSSARVKVECDECGDIYETPYRTYTQCVERNGKAICKHCSRKLSYIKAKETMKEKYGVDTPSHIPGVTEKIRQTNIERYGGPAPLCSSEIRQKVETTNLEKYGCANPNQNKEIREKIEKTNLEKYGFKNAIENEEVKNKAKQTNLKNHGVCWPMQSKEILDKSRQTNLEKYGVEYAGQIESSKEKAKQTRIEKYGTEYFFQTQQFKDKYKQTMIEKYGVENPSQYPEIQEKKWITMTKNGTTHTTIQQEQIFSIIQTKYPEAILEKPEGNFSLDIVIEHNGQKIDIECDGAYWHSDSQKDRRRDEVNKSKGYKILRIRYGHEIPDSERIFEAIDELLNTDTNYIRIHSKDSTK